MSKSLAVCKEMISISAMSTYALINLFMKSLELACETFRETEKCKIKLS